MNVWRRLESGRGRRVDGFFATKAPLRFDETSDVVVERVQASTLFFPSWRAYRAMRPPSHATNQNLSCSTPRGRWAARPPTLSSRRDSARRRSPIPSRIPFVASSLRYASCAGPRSRSVLAPSPTAKRYDNAQKRFCPSFRFHRCGHVSFSSPQPRGPSRSSRVPGS